MCHHIAAALAIECRVTADASPPSPFFFRFRSSHGCPDRVHQWVPKLPLSRRSQGRSFFILDFSVQSPEYWSTLYRERARQTNRIHRLLVRRDLSANSLSPSQRLLRSVQVKKAGSIASIKRHLLSFLTDDIPWRPIDAKIRGPRLITACGPACRRRSFAIPTEFM